MSTLTAHLISKDLNVQANFTAVFGVISGFFATAGMVQTSDTGQVNLSTQTSGYQIWGFGDSLQSTAPWYLKVTYGESGGDGQPIFTFQVGTATDGVGNLTGQTSAIMGPLQCITASSSVQNCYFSGNTNRISWCLWDGPTQFEGLNFGMERTKDNSGVDTATGVILFGRANGVFPVSQTDGAQQVFSAMIPASGSISTAQKIWPAALNLAQKTMQTGSSIGWAYPIPFNGAPFNCGKNFLLYQNTDFPSQSVQSLLVYGSNHNYLVCSPNTTSPMQPPGSAHALMMFE